MSLTLINLQTSEQITLNEDNPLIIGRSNIPGCADKRISRNHGRITRTSDGKIRVVALHQNPCFFTRNGVPPVHQLNKNEEETLSEGDCIGLLPDTFWFRITKENETEIKTEVNDSDLLDFDTSNENVNKNTQTENNDPDRFNSETRNDINGAADTFQNNLSTNTEINAQKENSNNTNNINGSAVPNPDASAITEELPTSSGERSCFRSPEFQKTRRLPLWMYEIDEPKPKRAALKNKDENSKRTEVPEDTKKKIEKDLTPSKKSACDVKTSENGFSPTASSGMSAVDGTNSIVSNDESQNERVQSSEERLAEENERVQSSGALAEENEKGDEVVIDCSPQVQKRGICFYEGSCYRKNPQHRTQFSHPGDADFVEYKDRPVCEFGASCYRRNKFHRVEFRHPSNNSNHRSTPSSSSCTSIASTAPPAKRRKKTEKKQDSNSDEQEDSNEPEDSDLLSSYESSGDFTPSESEEEWNSYTSETSQEENEN